MRKSPCLALCALLAACGSHDDRLLQLPAGLPVAETVNGTAVPEEMIAAFARVKAPQADMTNPAQRAEFLRVLADYLLLAEQARRENLMADPKFAADVEVARLSEIANETLRRMQDAAPLTDEMLKAEYDARVAQAPKVDYDFSGLLFDNEAQASAAAADLNAGKPFAQVYDAWKDKAKQANVFTHVRTDQLPPSLDQALAALKPGEETHAPVKSDFGWHLVRLDAVTPIQAPPFDKIKEQIRQDLRRKIGEERLAKLKSQAKIDYPVGAAPAPVAPVAPPAPPATGKGG